MNNIVKLTIADAVRKVLVNHPYIDQFFRDKCVNYSALAENITPKLKEILSRNKINKEAVIMSIIRYSANLKSQDISKKVLLAVAESNITLKTDIMYLNIPKTIENLRKVEKFYSKINWDKGELLFLVQGISEISVVVDKSNYPILKNMLKDQQIELQFPLSSIVILHSPKDAEGPGFIHFITKPIANAGISIEMLTLTRDTIFIVDQKNSSKLFELIKDLIEESRDLIK